MEYILENFYKLKESSYNIFLMELHQQKQLSLSKINRKYHWHLYNNGMELIKISTN